MIYLEKFKIFESKNYGKLYHSLWRMDDRKAVETTLSILEKGFKFSDDHGVWKPMLKKDNLFKRKHWDFLNSDKLKTISVTRDSSTKNNFKVTFVLDGNSISNNYKIEPCNLKAPTEIRFSKDKNNSWNTYNSRYSSEEKILSKRDYLESKYITEIILNGLSEEDINTIKSNTNIKITTIDTSPNKEKLDRVKNWKNITQ